MIVLINWRLKIPVRKRSSQVQGTNPGHKKLHPLLLQVEVYQRGLTPVILKGKGPGKNPP